MKTTTKVILAISLAMIVLGTGLSTIAWAVSGGNIGVIWSPQNGFYRGSNSSSPAGISRNLEKDSVSPGAFQSVDLSTDYGTVKLIPGDDYRVDYSLFADLPPVEIRVEGGVLIVDNTPDILNNGINVMNFGSWNLFNNLGDNAYINVYYPRSVTLADVTLSNDMGALKAEGLQVSGALDISADMGEIKLESITAGDVTLRADMGAVGIDGLTADTLTATLSMGALEAEDCAVGRTELDLDMGGADIQGDFDDIDIRCDMGGVEFKTSRPRSDYFIDMSTDLGGATVDGEHYRAGSAGSPDAPYRITITCGMGGADLSFGR